jgi:tetratricopeptide (TPR) repeat protein
MNSIKKELVAIGQMANLPVVSLMVASTILLSACSQADTPTAVDTKVVAQQEAVWQADTEKAVAALQSKDYASAKKLYKQALLDAMQLGQEHPAVAASLSNMANFYYAQGDGQQADQLYRRAIQLKEKNLGIEHQEIAVDLIGLGSVYFTKKKYAEAEPFFTRALQIREKAFGADDLRTAEAQACVARTDLHLNKFDDAATHYKEALATLDKLKQPVQGQLLTDYAIALRKTNDGAEAQKLEARAKEANSKKASAGGTM